MKTLAIITGYFFTICILGCLIAYPIFLLTGSDIERIVSRSILILAVLLFYPTCKYLNIQNIADIGWVKSNAIRVMTRAWAMGFIMLLPISIVYFACGYRVPETNSLTMVMIFSALLSAIISGLLIGIIEESVFRGLLQSQLSRGINLISAIIIVNIIYSSVHFLQAPDDIQLDTITWYSGFILLASAFSNLTNIGAFTDAWIALFLAGVFLSLICSKTNNLIWCIGIHAGWVAHIKLFKEFTDRDNTAQCATLASNYDNYVGELSTLLIITILAIWGILHSQRKTN